MLDAPADFHQTVMPITGEGDSDPVIVAAKKLADKLRAKRAYTNTATFTIRCQVGRLLSTSPCDELTNIALRRAGVQGGTEGRKRGSLACHGNGPRRIRRVLKQEAQSCGRSREAVVAVYLQLNVYPYRVVLNLKSGDRSCPWSRRSSALI